jgi:hypothetical protein
VLGIFVLFSTMCRLSMTYARTFFYAPLCTLVLGERCTHVPPPSKGTLGSPAGERARRGTSGKPSIQGQLAAYRQRNACSRCRRTIPAQHRHVIMVLVTRHPYHSRYLLHLLSAFNTNRPKWPASSSHVAVWCSVFGHGPV